MFGQIMFANLCRSQFSYEAHSIVFNPYMCRAAWMQERKIAGTKLTSGRYRLQKGFPERLSHRRSQFCHPLADSIFQGTWILLQDRQASTPRGKFLIRNRNERFAHFINLQIVPSEAHVAFHHRTRPGMRESSLPCNRP